MGGEEPAPAQHQPMPEKAISADTVDIRRENLTEEVVTIEVMSGEEPEPAQHQPMPAKAVSAATTVDIRAENVAEVVSVEVKSWNSVKRTKDPFDPPGVQFSKYGWKRIANDGPPSNGDMFHAGTWMPSWLCPPPKRPTLREELFLASEFEDDWKLEAPREEVNRPETPPSNAKPCEDKLELEVALDELNEQPYSKEFIIDFVNKEPIMEKILGFKMLFGKVPVFKKVGFSEERRSIIVRSSSSACPQSSAPKGVMRTFSTKLS